MKVVTRANEFIALKHDNSNKFYFELGHYIPSKFVRKDKDIFSHTLYIRDKDDEKEETLLEYGNYIIFNKYNNTWFCASDEIFKELFVKVKEVDENE